MSTPIGNLKDITLRALETLAGADAIACEDTRQTQKLLTHYKIRVPLVSFHDHSPGSRLVFLTDEIRSGKKIAYVTDSGTPLVSDPGFTLLREALRANIPVEVVPGSSAFLTALVGSGLPCEKFVFEGYLSHKGSARRKQLEALRDEPRTIIFYESPHRIVKTLQAMREILGRRQACVAREMTKKFEEFLRGDLEEILEEVSKRRRLGEIAIVVEGKRD